MVAPLAPAIAAAMRLAASESVTEELAPALLRLAGGLGEDTDNKSEITVPVASEAIASISYHVAGIITVEFHRGGKRTYDFPGTEELFMEFLLAPSKGAFFNANFR